MTARKELLELGSIRSDVEVNFDVGLKYVCLMYLKKCKKMLNIHELTSSCIVLKTKDERCSITNNENCHF